MLDSFCLTLMDTQHDEFAQYVLPVATHATVMDLSKRLNINDTGERIFDCAYYSSRFANAAASVFRRR